MSEIEKSLLGALGDLDAAVKSLPAAQPKPNLQVLFSRIDELASQLPEATDPNLRHYLRKRSYEKARLFLEGRDGETVAGNCRTHVG
ncbi:MAG TPA: hypothetical protein VNT26_19455 [Candidatus Sulfotelmatobacter sp.]|nr:hypothetical protein [Candidatus Sulfotelmatobacter sp.]